MGQSAPQAPPPPDPYRTAAAEGQSNVQTAIANSVIGNPNTYGPTGSTTYAQSGEMQTITMPDGSTTQVPRYNQTTTLSAPEQNIYDLNARTRQNIGQIGVDQSQRIGDLLGKPVDYSDLKLDPSSFTADRQRVEQAMYERAAPQLDRELASERTRLTNMGFMDGTEAYRGAMDDYNRRINDLRLGITERGLAEQQGMYGMARDAANYEMSRRAAERNAPINEITALMSGSQVSMPNAPGYNAPTIAGTGVGQNIYNTAALQQKQYEQQVSQYNQNLAGMYGLGQAAIGGAARYWGGGGKVA
jgi:hypothetical protein